MIILTNLNQLDAGLRRARAIKPRCHPVEFGVYQVQGSGGNWYIVHCWRNDSGQKLVDCSCTHDKPRRRNIPCYHMSVAVGVHMLLAMARQAVAKMNLPESVIQYGS